ncbi:dihydroorotate dehydrogenase [Alistipes putredinis]|uniref:dihydroorotate dehydrogenase n=1 Tax=Alistipes putredinis TaxID=28117 RepID=UPI0039675817
MADLSVKIGGLELKNPVMTASGTCGYGLELQDFMDISQLGGIIVKGTTLHPRGGNPYPRMAETPMGMLNTVGLQNKGVDYFVRHIYPEIEDIGTNIIVNVAGFSIEEYVRVAEIIGTLDKIPAIELNISCPNVKLGGMEFGKTAKGAYEVIRAVREAYKKTLIVKLSPNVTDITEIARAAEDAGADSVSLINTLLGMAVDIEKRRPVLSTVTGGLSGAAVKPVALRMVWQVAQAVRIPIIGLGGIADWRDAVEFLMAGASAVQIGTATFIKPTTSINIVTNIHRFLEDKGISSVYDIIGCLHVT